jgi:hypothetical protein
VHHSTTASSFIRITLGCALTLSVALGAGVIGASAASAASQSSPPSRASIQKAFKAYETCLAKHGVKLPKRTFRRPSSTGGSTSNPPPTSGTGAPPAGRFPGFRIQSSTPKVKKALNACKGKLPKNLGPFGRNGGRPVAPTPAQQAALTKFEQCMAAHGVKIASNASFQTIRSLMQADPSAANACRSDLNGAFGRPPGRPGIQKPSATTS